MLANCKEPKNEEKEKEACQRPKTRTLVNSFAHLQYLTKTEKVKAAFLSLWVATPKWVGELFQLGRGQSLVIQPQIYWLDKRENVYIYIYIYFYFKSISINFFFF